MFFYGMLVLVLLSSAQTGADRPEPLVLRSEKAGVTPTEFYIKNVVDERSDRSALADIYFAEAGKPASYPLDLQGGSFTALRAFILEAMPRNASARPVVVRLRECKIKETLSEKNLVNGQIQVAFDFDLEKTWGHVNLTRYAATARYSRTITNSAVIEPVLRQLLIGSMTYINNWMIREAPRNVKLAKGVNVSLSDYVEQDADTIYYQSSRPLVWDDFRDTPRNSRFNAEVFPSFGYEQHTKIVNGIIHIDLSIKVYVIKSSSWVHPGRQNAYSLNHEQRHFDIVKIIGERFKQKIRSEKLTAENYEGIINVEYLEFFREMNKQQKAYDAETSHGSNQMMQEEWNRKIDKELATEHTLG
jgi:hypothetical protein